jgi:hypothetical protein
MEEEPAAAVKKALKTPIREEIEARRKTIATPAPTPAAAVAAFEVASEPVQQLSMSSINADDVKNPKVVSRLKLFAALEARRRPKHLFKGNLINAKLKKHGELRKARKAAHVDSALQPEFIQVIETRRQSLGLYFNSDAIVLKMFSPLKKAIEDRRKSYSVVATSEPSPISTKKEQLIAACQQLSVDAFASALENQNIPDCSDLAIAEFLKKPSRFSLSPNRFVETTDGSLKIENPQPVDVALLSSLSDDNLQQLEESAESISTLTGIDMSAAEALVVESYVLGVHQCEPTAPVTSTIPVDASEYFGASLTKLFSLSEEFEDDSDRDYRLVSEYARDIQESGGIGSAAAYGVALDTFLADPVKFRSMFAPKKSTNRPQKANPQHTPTLREELYLGASLNRLFQDNFGRTQEEKDFDLVSAFAEDLEQNGNVSSSVAYGVALDTFLADPVEFRFRFGSKTRGVVAESEAVENDMMVSLKTADLTADEITQPLSNPAPEVAHQEGKPARASKRKAAVSDVETVQNTVEEEKIPAPVSASRTQKRHIASNQEAEVEAVAPPTRSSKGRGKGSLVAVVETAVEEPPAKKPTRGKAAKIIEPVIEEIATAILCDGCDAEYFLDDVGLKSIPKGDWFCSQCEVKKQTEKAAPKAVGKRKVAEIAPVAEAAPASRPTRGKAAKKSDAEDAHAAASAPEPIKRVTRSRK